MPTIQLQFVDRCVTYETFIADLARALVPKVKEALLDRQDTISQRKAYRLYGQGNVARWIQQGRLIPFSKRPGITEYKIDDLERCKARVQDYL